MSGSASISGLEVLVWHIGSLVQKEFFYLK